MLHMKNFYSARKLFLVFVILSSLIFFLFIQRVSSGELETHISDGQIIYTADQYDMGSVIDRSGQVIVWEEEGEMIWSSPETQAAFEAILGVGIEETLNSKMTIAGNCPWLFGIEEDRFSIYGLMRPNGSRIGGSVRVTLDKDLQEYIYWLLQEKGYPDASVVVSDWENGYIYAIYGPVFENVYSPGSAIKPVLAAAALSIDPALKDYVYNCNDENHNFQTGDGVYRINCIYNLFHGEMSMEDAIAYSCNGYFISLLQQVDEAAMKKELRRWGFDTTIAYDQFMYWDHSFMKDSSEAVDYLLAGIGQANVMITPAGLNFCTNALLNQGILVEPIWIQEKTTSPEAKWQSVLVDRSYTLCDGEAADMVRDMMQKVVEYGTGTGFYYPGFACKTGTAQKSDAEGNLTGQYTVWTTGGLVDPATPYSVTVCLDNVPEDITSTHAGEISKEILVFMEGGQ